MEGKKKGKKKGRKESSFPASEWLPSYLQGKERNPPETQCFQGIRRKKEREKEEERDGFRIRFLRGIQGKKGWKKGKKKKGRMLFFSLSGGLFSLQKKEEIQWFQGKGRRKKMRFLAWRIGFLGEVRGREGRRKGRRKTLQDGVSQGPLFTLLFCFL